MAFKKIAKFLFDPGATPSPEWSHPRLGNAKWIEDAEGWEGQIEGLRYLLCYERKSSDPIPKLVDYALELLSSEFDLISRVAHVCHEAKSDFEPFYHREIDKLRVEGVSIFWAGKIGKAIVSLDGGQDYRAWRVELAGTQIGGLGFDS